MPSLVKQMFALNLRIMQTFGHYPPKNHKLLYKIYAYLVYVFFTVPTPILTASYLIFGEDVNLELIANNAFSVAEMGCFIFKLLQFIKNAENFHKCLYMVESPIFLNYNPRQQSIVDECVRVCKRNSNFFFNFCVLTAISWAIVPLFGIGKVYKLPLDVWLPFDVTSGGLPYILSYIYLVISVGIGSLVNGVIDPLIGGLAYFATAQIKILKDNLENLNEATGESDAEKNSKIIYGRIKSCVKHHDAILNFVKTYENTFSPMVFVQFSASVFVICISLLQLSMVQPFTVSFFSMVIFINAVLMEILFYCYYGTTLFEESNTLTTSAYMNHWYECDVVCRKALIIFMERCKKPIIVPAGKILTLSLDTFTTIIRRSYSLLAVLQTL